jgi:hypothetical protein
VPLAPLGKIQDVQQTKSNHLIPQKHSAGEGEDPFDPSTRLEKGEGIEEAASSGQKTHLFGFGPFKNPTSALFPCRFLHLDATAHKYLGILKNEVDIGDPDRAMSIKTVANPNLTMSVTCGTIRI